ncbi:unnamed protein product [Vitrella brassicaformis CCMP3155]|uniref:Carboxymethylenebutenolidase homolog n=1 Tax=Vitrella brassicaformis (strain CCMP3155) TaxID=1169540 RepID=A0A0G4EPR0_VITBC|nr:unnamed protein product [Vitrella brassicaformis CCMP3155]|eukprot:CEL99425.1 unnamed protein product [Vitrella brassicaformis CCMP3155]
MERYREKLYLSEVVQRLDDDQLATEIAKRDLPDPEERGERIEAIVDDMIDEVESGRLKQEYERRKRIKEIKRFRFRPPPDVNLTKQYFDYWSKEKYQTVGSYYSDYDWDEDGDGTPPQPDPSTRTGKRPMFKIQDNMRRQYFDAIVPDAPEGEEAPVPSEPPEVTAARERKRLKSHVKGGVSVSLDSESTDEASPTASSTLSAREGQKVPMYMVRPVRERETLEARVANLGMRDPRRAVLMLTDVFGYRDRFMRRVADRLADTLSLPVFVPDLFLGQPWSADRPPAEYEAWRSQHDPDRVDDTIGASLRFLKESYKMDVIAVVGFCYGGGRALETGVRYGGMEEAEGAAVCRNRVDKSVRCVVAFYPTRYDVEAIGRQMRVPTCCVYAANDTLPGARKADAERLYEAFRANEDLFDFMVQIFDNTTHGFVHQSARDWTNDLQEEDQKAEKAYLISTSFLEFWLPVREYREDTDHPIMSPSDALSEELERFVRSEMTDEDQEVLGKAIPVVPVPGADLQMTDPVRDSDNDGKDDSTAAQDQPLMDIHHDHYGRVSAPDGTGSREDPLRELFPGEVVAPHRFKPPKLDEVTKKRMTQQPTVALAGGAGAGGPAGHTQPPAAPLDDIFAPLPDVMNDVDGVERQYQLPAKQGPSDDEPL